MPTLTAEQSRTIAKAYADLAAALSAYRFGHWTALTKAQRAEIESHEWTLLTYSSNMTSHAIGLAVADLSDVVRGIAKAAKALSAAARKVTGIKRVLGVATAAVALGAAVASGHPIAIGEAISRALGAAGR